MASFDHENVILNHWESQFFKKTYSTSPYLHTTGLYLKIGFYIEVRHVAFALTFMLWPGMDL